MTHDDNTFYREEKRVFQADTDVSPPETLIAQIRNQDSRLESLEKSLEVQRRQLQELTKELEPRARAFRDEVPFESTSASAPASPE